MGLGKVNAKLLFKECKRRPFEGHVLTLGKQDIHFTFESLETMLAGMDMRKPASLIARLSTKPYFARRHFIDEQCFLQSLGFSQWSCMDYSDYEGADCIFDLNTLALPPQFHCAFDAIIDSGTTEHVFHVPNALANMFNMLKEGGRIIHMLPMSNYVDHGFYMFSPTLFWDYYAANRFEINRVQIIRSTGDHGEDPWEVFDYHPGALERLTPGELDDAAYHTVCIVTKTKDSTAHVIPQQGYYAKAWKAQPALPTPTNGAVQPGATSTFTTNVKTAVKRIPLVGELVRRLYRSIRPLPRPEPRPKGLGLPVAARL